MAKGLFECLHEANLGQYIEQFRLHGVKTLETLATLSLQDYVKFGITSSEDRKRLFHLIHIVKGVQEERRMSSLEISMQDKENTPVKINTGGRSKAMKDINDHSVIPSSVSIQWTPTKKRQSPMKQTFVQSDDTGVHVYVSYHSHHKAGVELDTLKRLEDRGGILFVETSTYQPKTSPRNRRQHDLRQSLSDSEIAEDLADSSTNPADVTGFGAPKLKSSSVEVIDHKEKSYNYGIPGRKSIKPAQKQTGSNLDTSKIKVCVRKRPLLRKEINSKEKDIIGTEGSSTVVLNESKVAVDLTEFMQMHKYHFDEVFDDTCSNLEVYYRTAKPLVPYVFKRAKATCFAYGQTGAGKTYTMLGNKETKGLYLLAAEDIFTLLAEDKSASRLSVWVSYFEIYCGQLFDLLNGRQRLHAREDSRHNVCIAGLNEVQVSGPQGLIRVVEQGNRLRSTGSSGVNADSSRSHAILQIELQDPGRRKLGRFSFIDLAGSERACDTADPSKVTRFEGAEINTSLLALKECIRALDQDHRHTPFRQSKLTQVLKDSFVGQSRTCMIANIAPCASATEHTLNTLRYADRVKELRKQAPASNNSPSSPHLLAPTTFSPGNTSTPVKPNKQPFTTRQPNNTSTPINKGKTPRHQSSDFSKNSTSRSGNKERTSFRKTPIRKTRNSVKSNRTDVNLSKSVKNDSTKVERKTVSRTREELTRKDTPTRQGRYRDTSSSKEAKIRDTPSKAKIRDTPSKRSEEAKSQAREAFLMNSSLPVWEPPKEMELIQKTPDKVAVSPPAWEIDNPRFNKKKSGQAVEEESKNTQNMESSFAKPDPGEDTEEQKVDVEESNIKSKQECERSLTSTEQLKNQHNSSTEEKIDTSFNSDSTIELLAEIDHALHTSLVSPLTDENSPCGQAKSGVTSSNQQSHFETRNDKTKLRDENGQSSANTKVLNNSSQNNEIAKQHQRAPVAVITGVKSPEPKKGLHRSYSVPSQMENQHLHHLDPHHTRSPGLRTRLSGRGIQTLPSPREMERASARMSYSREKAKVRQSLFHDPLDDVNANPTRPQTAQDVENTSGVIVSTSFAEYLTSHGINIPDIIVSPDKKSPREESKTDVSYDHSRGETYSHNRDSLSRHDYSLSNNRYTISGGDNTYRQSNEQSQHRDNLTSRTVDNLNQRNILVQSKAQHGKTVNPRQAAQFANKSGIYIPFTNARNVSRHVQPDLLAGEQIGSNRTRPTPIGQNGDNSTNQSTNATPSDPKIQYNPHRKQFTESHSRSMHSPVSVEVLKQYPINPKEDGFTPIAHSIQPNQHVIPRAFTKESLGRSGVYPSYQSPSQSSPIVKETLHNTTIPQESSHSNTASRAAYHGSSQRNDVDNSVMTTPKLKINLAGVDAVQDDVSRSLELAKQRLSGVVQQNSAITRAKDLLLSAHAEQVDEIQQLCEKEWMLIAQFKQGEKDLPEYLDYVEDLLRSKLRCIDTFRDQLDSFATHTPASSPRAPMEAS